MPALDRLRFALEPPADRRAPQYQAVDRHLKRIAAGGRVVCDEGSEVVPV
jgi:hypothetical protein